MPRLTNTDYLKIRRFLAQLWDQADGADFAVLPGYAQRDLHDFFAPTVSMTDRDAAVHRKQMSKAFPSLPHSAGRAFEALRASLEDRPNQIVERHTSAVTGAIEVGSKTRQLRVLGITRPKIDLDSLAHALVQLSREDVDGKLLKLAKKHRRRAERKAR